MKIQHWSSYGVVAIMKNGAGPVVLIRTELDALPVNEKNRTSLRQHSQSEKTTPAMK